MDRGSKASRLQKLAGVLISEDFSMAILDTTYSFTYAPDKDFRNVMKLMVRFLSRILPNFRMHFFRFSLVSRFSGFDGCEALTCVCGPGPNGVKLDIGLPVFAGFGKVAQLFANEG
jgi:hypothetical protein